MSKKEEVRDRKKYFRDYYRKYRKDKREYVHKINRKSALKKYGLSIEDYEDLLKKQKYKCKICGKLSRNKKGTVTKLKKAFASNYDLKVDHCHKSKKVRGLLCNECNTALGKFNDDPNVLLLAFEYLMNI